MLPGEAWWRGRGCGWQACPAIRARRLTPAEFPSGAFTISNLGMFGIGHFTAVINTPEAAILGAGAAARQPVVRGGQLVEGTGMALTLSTGRRVIDHAAGAGFLAGLRALPGDTVRAVA